MNEWDSLADSWDTTTGTRAYSQAAFESLQTVLAENNSSLDGAVVCDFGAGTGLLTELLVTAGASVDAFDTSSGMRSELRAKSERLGWRGVRVFEDIPANTPADKDRYDLVVCSSVCGFVPDYPATVQALVNKLRPGGLFVQWDWERDPSNSESNGLLVGDIRAALAEAQLIDITVATAFSIDVDGFEMAPLIGHGVLAD